VLLQSTLRQAWSRELPETAKCVQVVDVQCVLQFTSLLAAGCALHRRTSRVIHRSELFRGFFVLCAIVYTDRSRTEGTNEKNPTRGAEARWRQAALSLRPRPRGSGGEFSIARPQLAAKPPPFLPRVWLSPALPRGSIKRGRRYPFSSDGRTGRPSALTVLRSTRRAPLRRGNPGKEKQTVPSPSPLPDSGGMLRRPRFHLGGRVHWDTSPLTNLTWLCFFQTLR